MIKSIRSFFDRNLEPTESSTAGGDADTGAGRHDPMALAACALLLELAHADDEFCDEERDHIEEALVRHFDLERGAVEELITLADRERRRAVDLYQFTRLIADRYDLGQKMVLAEVMWRVVYADGKLASHESYLMRKISNLLGLKPGFLSDARKRAAGQTD